MMKLIFTHKAVVGALAKVMADHHRKADEYYYELDNQNMSSFVLDRVPAIIDIANELGVCSEMYREAYKIYDFRNSGKEGYTLANGKIVRDGE